MLRCSSPMRRESREPSTSSEQPGRVIRLRAGRRTVFLDIRNRVEYGGEQGLLGLAFDPGYASNRRFYVAFTSRSGRNTVERFRSDGAKAVPSSRTLLLAVPDPYGNHNGGHLAFGPDGRLYTSIGDGGSGGDPENRSQNLQSQFGKLLTLDVSKPAAGWSIAALGLRNPWRFSFDRATGDLYIGDVGQGEIEEVSFTPRASPGLENYGWDLFEGSRRYEEKAAGPGELVFPVAEYRPRPRLQRHRRLCLPGPSAPERTRPLHLRRLLQWHRVELPCRRRCRDRSSRRAVPGRQPQLVRRERSRRALRSLPRAARSTA